MEDYSDGVDERSDDESDQINQSNNREIRGSQPLPGHARDISAEFNFMGETLDKSTSKILASNADLESQLRRSQASALDVSPVLTGADNYSPMMPIQDLTEDSPDPPTDFKAIRNRRERIEQSAGEGLTASEQNELLKL